MAWSDAARAAAAEVRAQHKAKFHSALHIGRQRGGKGPIKLLLAARAKLKGSSTVGKARKTYLLATRLYKDQYK